MLTDSFFPEEMNKFFNITKTYVKEKTKRKWFFTVADKVDRSNISREYCRKAHIYLIVAHRTENINVWSSIRRYYQLNKYSNLNNRPEISIKRKIIAIIVEFMKRYYFQTLWKHEGWESNYPELRSKPIMALRRKYNYFWNQYSSSVFIV